jgi:hypothetical protein
MWEPELALSIPASRMPPTLEHARPGLNPT